MKRLLARIGITYFSVLAAAFYLPPVWDYVLCGAALLLTAIFFIIRKWRRTIYLPAMAIMAVVACIVHIGYTYFTVLPVQSYATGEEHSIEAVMIEEPYRSYGKVYYRLRAEKIDGKKADCKLMLKLPIRIDVEVDDVLSFRSEINAMENQYFLSKGFYIVSDSYDTVVTADTPKNHTLYYQAIQIRKYMREALDAYLPEESAALCKAILIGDKYSLDLSLRDNFRYAGASYFIVVSGMHFAVIILILQKLLSLIRFRGARFLRFAISLAVIFAYMSVTGFQPSVMRSGIMISFVALGRCLRRLPYSLNHLGIAGLVMPCFLSPYSAGDIGLILSFYATMSILIWANPIAKKLCYMDEYGNTPMFDFGRWIQKRRSKKEKKVSFDAVLFRHKLRNTFCSILAVSLAANILVFPITVFVFHEFSLVTLLSSVLLYAEIYLILILSLAVCVFYYCWVLKYVAMAIAVPLNLLCKLVLWIVETLGSLPFAYIRVGAGWFYLWMALTVILGVTVLMYRNHYRYVKLAVFCSAILLLMGSVTHAIVEMQTYELEVYSCGNGMCVGLNYGGDFYLFSMDAKTKDVYKITDELSYRYGSARLALCLNEDDLKKYQLYRKDEFAISDYLLYDSSGNDDAENTIHFGGDSVFALDDGLTLSVRMAGDTPVPIIEVNGKRILLLLKKVSFADLPEELRSADVIVMSRALADYEGLRCDSLIISDTHDDALKTAKILNGCYSKVYITGEESVTYPLR
ncbi:MAG: ComEC/Rec2 family competence protein [Ruminococcus sp.]|nr:ComEC/Rec2 family competence protein [Ruminococcus sp.]